MFLILLAVGIFCAVKMSLQDIRSRTIPDVYLFPFLLAGLSISAFYVGFTDIYGAIIAAVFGYLLSFGLGILFGLRGKKDAIGLGDVKLIAAGGAWLGPLGLAIALVTSCIFGFVWGAVKKQRAIPFAPFFLSATLVAAIIQLVISQ